MQSLGAITLEDLRDQFQEQVIKFEVYNGSAWVDLTELYPGSASALAAWKRRKLITVQTSYLDANLSDFPLYVPIVADYDIGAECLATGYDIRFTEADGVTLLKYERVSFSVTGGAATGEFWVKTDLATAGTRIFIYYGNDDAADGADPENVWDANYAAVWHMNDGTTSTTLDSTTNDNDGTKKAANEPPEADGKLGKGQNFDGIDDRVDVVENATLQSNEFTRSIWFKINSSPDDTTIREIWRHAYRGYMSLRNDLTTKRWEVYFHDSVPTACGWYPLRTDISVGEWHHVVIWADGSDWGVNYDGAEVASGSYNGTVRTSAANMTFGCGFGPARWFDCEVDEARVSSIARSSSWLKFEYRNQVESDNELTWAEEESLAVSCLKTLSCSVAGAGAKTEPIAGEWSATLDNPDGIFMPYHPTSGWASLIDIGRQVRLSWGLRKSLEMLTDPGLEAWTSSTNLTSWTENTSGTSTVEREATEIHGGTYSAKLSVDSSNSFVSIYQAKDLVAGQDYDFNVWGKIPVGYTGAIVIGAIVSGTTWILHADNVWRRSTDPGYLGHVLLVGTGEWKCYGVRFTFLAGATAGQTTFTLKRNVLTSQVAYFDDPSLKPVAKTAYYFQRMIGYMDTPSYDLVGQSVSVSGTDRMKVLADLKLFSPWVAWGDVETFDSKPSPGGTGSEIYAEADACDTVSEADNVTPWEEGASGGAASSEGPGEESDYYLMFQRDAPGPTEQYVHNSNAGTLVAGSQYLVSFWGRTAGDQIARLVIYQTSGSTAVQIGWVDIGAGDRWWRYQEIVTATASGNLQLRVSSSGKYAEDGDQILVDEISVKLYDSETWNIYELPPAANGIYYVELDGEPVWKGDEDGSGGWHAVGEPGSIYLYFSEELVIDAGTDNLDVFYYTDTAPEDMIADLLVAGRLYTTRALAKAAMSYTATGVLIEKPWFEPGTTGLDAVRMICERVNYRFWFGWDGTPNFQPAPVVTSPADLDLLSTKGSSSITLGKDIEEVRNHITIEGCERSVLNVATQEVERSNWKGDLADEDSILLYKEKTHAISNHLFQGQAEIDAMAAELLAYYKGPKVYLDFTTNYFPAPLEVGDTVKVYLPTSAAVAVEKLAIIRTISLSGGEAKYTCEIYVPFDTELVVSNGMHGHSAWNVELVTPGILGVQNGMHSHSADNIALVQEQIYEYTTTQAGTSRSVPAWATSAVIECWGSGGQGGDGNLVGRGGGGGGGGYSKATVAVSSGQTLLLYLAVADATYVTRSSTTLCLANEGAVGTNTEGGGGGPTGGAVGDVKYAGGNGYFYATGFTGGGGGSSAGTGSNGNNAYLSTGATAVTGGGNGGDGGFRYADGSDPTTPPGGGGGGAGADLSTERYGGAGSLGKIKITFRS